MFQFLPATIIFTFQNLYIYKRFGKCGICALWLFNDETTVMIQRTKST